MENFREEVIVFIDKYFEYIVKHKALCFFKKDRKVKSMRVPDYVFEEDGVDVEVLIKEVCSFFELDDIDFQESYKLFDSIIIYYGLMKDRNSKGGFKSKESLGSLFSVFGGLFEITECDGLD